MADDHAEVRLGSRPGFVRGSLAGRGRAGEASAPDAIELMCPACTPQWHDGRWEHDRACLFARKAAAA